MKNICPPQKKGQEKTIPLLSITITKQIVPLLSFHKKITVKKQIVPLLSFHKKRERGTFPFSGIQGFSQGLKHVIPKSFLLLVVLGIHDLFFHDHALEFGPQLETNAIFGIGETAWHFLNTKHEMCLFRHQDFDGNRGDIFWAVVFLTVEHEHSLPLVYDFGSTLKEIVPVVFGGVVIFHFAQRLGHKNGSVVCFHFYLNGGIGGERPAGLGMFHDGTLLSFLVLFSFVNFFGCDVGTEVNGDQLLAVVRVFHVDGHFGVFFQSELDGERPHVFQRGELTKLVFYGLFIDPQEVFSKPVVHLLLGPPGFFSLAPFFRLQIFNLLFGEAHACDGLFFAFGGHVPLAESKDLEALEKLSIQRRSLKQLLVNVRETDFQSVGGSVWKRRLLPVGRLLLRLDDAVNGIQFELDDLLLSKVTLSLEKFAEELLLHFQIHGFRHCVSRFHRLFTGAMSRHVVLDRLDKELDGVPLQFLPVRLEPGLNDVDDLFQIGVRYAV
mmetsp:Transcript_30575/g.79739  ORF Transcript_30575/g.79739 Transcript_30575/m.79739 type:complete len:495 (+) Transcript_30575:2029-3513(+)